MKCGRKRRVVAHEGGRKRGVLLYSIRKVHGPNKLALRGGGGVQFLGGKSIM